MTRQECVSLSKANKRPFVPELLMYWDPDPGTVSIHEMKESFLIWKSIKCVVCILTLRSFFSNFAKKKENKTWRSVVKK